MKIKLTALDKLLSSMKDLSPKIPKKVKFKSELDWSPESWFGKRPKGAGRYTKEEILELNSNIPEYLQIEKLAKHNGTWLKLSDGSTWEGDPREWVMILSKKYLNFIKDSKLKGNYSHESNNWTGTEIKPSPVVSGKLFGDGFYITDNPTGLDTVSKKRGHYILEINNIYPPTRYNIVVNSKSPVTYTEGIDRKAPGTSIDASDPNRVGSFHNPNYTLNYLDYLNQREKKYPGTIKLLKAFNPNLEKEIQIFDPRLENDVMILEGAKHGTSKLITGFPNRIGAAPNIKFVTGNTGNFSTSPELIGNVFRGLSIPLIIGTGYGISLTKKGGKLKLIKRDKR